MSWKRAITVFANRRSLPINSKMQFKAEKVTMGDLIVVITDAVLEAAQDEDMAYQL